MEFTKIPQDTFEKLQMNAGMLLKSFTPASAEYEESDILGATSGGITFTAAPTYTDQGEDIDNCPKNTKELKKLDRWDVTMSGVLLTVDVALAKELAAAADAASDKVTPRNDLKAADFTDLWLVADYSDKNTGTTAGYIAIHMMNALSTGGFQLQTADKEKGRYSFTYTAHYSIANQDTVPFEIYIKKGTAAA